MPPKNDRKCTIEGCERKHRAHGLCQYHFMRKHRGYPVERVVLTPEDRFWKFVQRDTATGCWLWRGGIDSTGGYGTFTLDNKSNKIKAHRFSYQLAKGAIPEGMVIDHLCRVRACVNPDHLEAVTFAENLIRGVGNQNRLYCKKGHLMTEGHFYRSNRGGRVCKECTKATSQAYRARKRARS